MGKYDEIVQITREYIQSYPDTDQAKMYASYEIYSLFKLGEYDLCLKLANNYLSSEKSRVNGFILDNIGLVYWKKGKMSLAESYMEKSLTIFTEIDDFEGMGLVYHDLALIKIETGFLSDAAKYLEKSIEFLEKINHDTDLGISYANLARVYEMQGYLANAKSYTEKAFKIFEKKGVPENLGFAYKVIGKIHQSQGEFLEAKEAFLKSYELRKKLDNDEDIAETLHSLIMLNYISDQELDVVSYLQELEDLASKSKEIKTYHYWQLSLGRKIMNQPRVFSRFQAKNNFREIIVDERAMVELKIDAIILTLHLLFLELQISEAANEIIREIESYISLLGDYARWEHSAPLEVEKHIVKARLHFLQREFPQARETLKVAEKIAAKGEILNLKDRVKAEITLLDENLKLWYSSLEMNPNIKNAVKNDEIVDYLRKIVKLGFS